MKHSHIPVMKTKLPTSINIISYLTYIDEHQIYSNSGPLLKNLEKRFADKLKVDESKVVLCANATLAIQGLC